MDESSAPPQAAIGTNKRIEKRRLDHARVVAVRARVHFEIAWISPGFLRSSRATREGPEAHEELPAVEAIEGVGTELGVGLC
jgi:hypothetical protein